MTDKDFKQEVLDVRKVIEKSTSKVSLRDLEKKGFRQVKVLRAGDINQLISNAVRKVLAAQPQGVMSEDEKKRVMAEARKEVDKSIAEKRALMQEKAALEQKAVQIEEAKKKLEARVHELNSQMVSEKKAFEEEKRAFAKERQSLYEKGLEGQAAASRNYEAQLDDLKGRLQTAEQRARDAVPRDEHEAQRQRAKQTIEELEEENERQKRKLRSLEEEAADGPRLRRAAEEAEESEQRARARITSLTEEVDRLQDTVAQLKAELAEAGSKPAAAANDPELQQMRLQMDRMKDTLSNIANSFAAGPPAAATGGGGGDMSKQFKQLQLNITDQIRKGLGGVRGGGDYDLDLTPEAAAALFAGQADVEVETNIRDVGMKEQKGPGVKDKLNKLRNLRKK